MYFSVLFTCLFFSISPIQSDEEIKKVLNQKLAAFELAMKNKELETVLSMFGADGAFGEAKGKQEIKRVLKSYFNNDIITYTMQSGKISVTPTLANHSGKLYQEIVINGHYKKNNGVFRIIWYNYNGNWAIQYLSIEQDNSN